MTPFVAICAGSVDRILLNEDNVGVESTLCLALIPLILPEAIGGGPAQPLSESLSTRIFNQKSPNVESVEIKGISPFCSARRTSA